MAPPRNPPPTQGGNAFTSKVGPLPVWAWAVVLLGAYFLYQHFKGTSTAAATGTTPAAGTQATPIPVGDQTGGGGAALGTSGTTPTPATAPVDTSTNTGETSGGGTSNGVTAVSQPTYSRPVYLAPPDTAAAAAMQEQVATTTSGRATKVGGLYHPGQNF